MATYKYPESQTIVNGALFIMSNVFDSGKFVKYSIRTHIEGQRKTIVFSHARIAEHLQHNPHDRDRRPHVMNGEEFIRLRLTIADTQL